MARKRPVGIKDLFGVVGVSDPQVSPDGGRVAFVRTEADYEKDEYLSDVWMAEGGSLDSSPRGGERTKGRAGPLMGEDSSSPRPPQGRGTRSRRRSST